MDQAHGLKQLLMERSVGSHLERPPRVIAIGGGKGGVGKTSIAVNLGIALRQRGRRVMVLDADLGLANVDVLLGLSPHWTLLDLIDGRCPIEALPVEGPEGLEVIFSCSGNRRMTRLSSTERAAIIRAFDELDPWPDYLLVDVAAGLSDDVLMFCAAADEVIMVACDDPSSMTDVYATMKVLTRECGVRDFQLLTNMMPPTSDGSGIHDRLLRVASRYLNTIVNHLGNIPMDDYMRRAAKAQKPLICEWPGSPASLAIRALAEAVERLGPRAEMTQPIRFFLRQHALRSFA
ncbi:MinD/ParA family ATP-binding protein [Frateuria aurantia]